MKKSLITFLILACLTIVASGAEQKSKPSNEELIRNGIKDFHKGMTSEDEAIRKEAFDKFMPKQADLKALFGEDAELIWPMLQKGLEFMKKNTIKFKEEFDQKGEIKEIKLIDVRKNDVSGRYKELIKVVPSSIPLYRAITKGENRSGGSSTFVVVNGRAMHIRGLESIYEEIVKSKK